MEGGRFVRCLTVDSFGRTYECWISPDGDAGSWEVLPENADNYGGASEIVYNVRKASPSGMAAGLVSAIRRGQDWKAIRRPQRGYGEVRTNRGAGNE